MEFKWSISLVFGRRVNETSPSYVPCYKSFTRARKLSGFFGITWVIMGDGEEWLTTASTGRLPYYRCEPSGSANSVLFIQVFHGFVL